MFPHLHVHSWFSFGCGASSPEALAEAAASRGIPALAVADTNTVAGVVEFQSACETAGIRPILGAHLAAGGEEAVLLAEDERGWGAVCRAVSGVCWQAGGGDRADRTQRLTERLAHDRQGAAVLVRDPAVLERLVRLSGPEGVWAELVPGRARHTTLAAARRLSVPAVVTNAAVLAHPQDWSRHRLLAAIAANATLDAESRASGVEGHASSPRPTRDSWLKPEAELARHFPDVPEALQEALALAERCRWRIPVGARVVPPRDADAGDSFARLRALAYAGAERRYGTIAPVTRDRLEQELAIIGLKGFADYFLVVHDIVQHGPTHCGRGSVANSVVSYCLGITHVEPLSAGLLFERFLNPERKDPPDIDLDFPWDERDRILAWVFRRWPHPRAAMVANVNCFRRAGALREVAKVHGRPAGEIREVTRRMPWYDDTPLPDLLLTHPNFRGLRLDRGWVELAREADPLVGTPRHLSLHPGGVVIVPGALTDYVATQPAAKVLDDAPGLTVPVIQFDKDSAEDAGLVKIDLLGNRSLAVIRDAIAAVHGNTGRLLDYTSAEAGEDEGTRALFRRGDTMGVFYTESPASRQLCAKSRADTFELLVLNTSIIRPASNRFIREYLERLHGKPWQPLHPSLRDVLAETFGIMVYQEDVANVCAMYAGMPLAQADGLRKALSKKRPAKHLAAYATEFFAGAEALARDVETTKRVWEMVLSFSGYSFCKGHSCSYIQVAQHSCFLRAHYPAEFMAGVLANGGGFYHPFAYVAEARRMGLTVRPPDVNASAVRTTGRGREVRIGLQFVKGLSAEAMDRIVAGRERGAPYASLSDLWSQSGLAADDLRTLVRVGACDSIAQGMTRPMLLWWVDSASRETPGGRRNGEAGMPHVLRLAANDSPVVPRLREYDEERRRREQYELLGFLTDCHPMDLWRGQLARLRPVPSTELHRHVGRSVLAAGMLTTAKPVHTAAGEPMEFATFDDGHGLIEAVLFPGIFASRGHVLFDQGPFGLRGKVDEEFGAVTFNVTGLDRVERLTGPRPEARPAPRAGRRVS
ncbi:MAG: DNA polymerase III subunit alpha [Gemmatimonadales bacterium]